MLDHPWKDAAVAASPEKLWVIKCQSAYEHVTELRNEPVADDLGGGSRGSCLGETGTDLGGGSRGSCLGETGTVLQPLDAPLR